MRLDLRHTIPRFDAIKWLLVGLLVLGGILIPLLILARCDTGEMGTLMEGGSIEHIEHEGDDDWFVIWNPDSMITQRQKYQFDNNGECTTYNESYYQNYPIHSWLHYASISYLTALYPTADRQYYIAWDQVDYAKHYAVVYRVGDYPNEAYYLTEPTPTPPITGIEPVITATSPTECSWNQSLSWTYDFAGKIEIPTENPNTYTDFIIRLYNRQSMEMGLSFTDIELTEFPDLSAGESYSWNLPDIDVGSSSTGYSLTYWLEGYNVNTLQPFRWSLTPVEICGAKTILSDQTEAPVSLIPTEWIDMIYEDCDSLEGFEKIMCEFTNFVKSIFAPSKAGLDGLSQDIDQIKTKFPFTYISEFFTFITDIKNGVDEDKGITFNILGNEGTVDFSFWESTTEVGGVVQTFSTIFKSFVIFVILIGFVGGWLIPFIRRIL